MMVGVIYCSLYILSFSYPLPVFNHVSLDAKLRFLNRTDRTMSADTIIIGSSVGVDNINGVLLEDLSRSSHEVLNYSAWGLNPVQIEQLLPVILDNRNIQRIIYAVLPGDFTRGDPFGNYDERIIRNYIYNTLSVFDRLFLLNKAANNHRTYWKTIRDWQEKYQNERVKTSLLFDRTGGVMLNIHDVDHELSKQHTDYKQPDDAAFQALERIMQTLAARNIRLYFAVMPQHQEPPEKDVKLAANISVFNERARNIVQFNQGYFLDMHELMELMGKYFVDRVHLNDEGASAVAEMLASVVDAEP
jgi:hypothetical protein